MHLSTTAGTGARWTGSTASAATTPAPGFVAPPLKIRSSPTTRSAQPRRSSAAPTSTASPSPRPTDPIVALRQAIGQQVTVGNLQAPAGNDLNHMVDDLAHTIATGKTGAVTTKLTALRSKLTTLNKEGKLSTDGYRVLSSAVDRVANPG
jgi:hypothetical protein